MSHGRAIVQCLDFRTGSDPMRAMTITQFGGPDVLKLADMPKPTPASGEVLVEVHAAALNPVDTKIRKGLHGPKTFPLIPGYDVSGVIAAIGPNVAHFKVGDEVYASPSLFKHGAHAEYVLVDARVLAIKPKSIDHVTAAAFPLVTLTAWEALHERVGMHRGETVLIHAGAGGVGHIALQLAHHHGCRVFTTASTDDSVALCKKLGADVVINYKSENIIERVKEETGGKLCPVVFDTVGGPVFDQSLDCVAPLGRMVTIVLNDNGRIVPALFRKNATLHMEFMGAKQLHNMNVESQGEMLATAAELIDAGKLKTCLHKVIALDDLPAAHAEQETGTVHGKIVIKMRG
ncbi:MAG: zinc-binding dehydrogenase [Planctomycetes bacterium]|nr:zinc-binding dehydrogenase [Planctomycetota bacterium]